MPSTKTFWEHEQEKNMNKQEIYAYLQRLGISHEITEHKAVLNMEELSEIKLPYPEAKAKNLFVVNEFISRQYIDKLLEDAFDFAAKHKCMHIRFLL